MTQSLESLQLLGAERPSGAADVCHSYGFTGRSNSDDVSSLKPNYSDLNPAISEATYPRTSVSSRQDYGHLLDPPGDPSGQWMLYHTKTGRMTGYMHYRGRLSTSKDLQKTSSSKNISPLPWKPAFVSSSQFGHKSSFQRCDGGMLTGVPAGRTPGRRGRSLQTSQGDPRREWREGGTDNVAMAGGESEGGSYIELQQTYTIHTAGVSATTTFDKPTEHSDTEPQPLLADACRGETELDIEEHGRPGNPITVAAPQAPPTSSLAPTLLGAGEVAAAEKTVEQRGREAIAAITTLTEQSLAVQRR